MPLIFVILFFRHRVVLPTCPEKRSQTSKNPSCRRSTTIIYLTFGKYSRPLHISWCMQMSGVHRCQRRQTTDRITDRQTWSILAQDFLFGNGKKLSTLVYYKSKPKGKQTDVSIYILQCQIRCFLKIFLLKRVSFKVPYCTSYCLLYSIR